jgi:DNA primase
MKKLDEINAAIFRQADRIFPELSLKRKGNGWIGAKGFFGREPHHSRPDKTYITAAFPNRIGEQGGGSKSFWDYIVESHPNLGGKSNRDIYEYLGTLVGIEFRIDSYKKPRAGSSFAPKPTEIPTELERDEEAPATPARQTELLQEAQSFFSAALEEGREHPTTTAGSVYKYLTEERGYLDEEILLLGLGALPSQQELRLHLQEKGFTDSEIEAHLPIHSQTKIGSSHVLTVPIVTEGTLHSFAFRHVLAKSDAPKYLNITGFTVGARLWNLPPDAKGKEIVLVESDIGAAYCSIILSDRIFAATKGNAIKPEQIEHLKRLQPSAVIVCLDSDDAGRNGGDKTVAALLAAGIPTRRATLTEKGPEDQIRNTTAEDLRKILKEAPEMRPELSADIAALPRCRSYADLDTLIKQRPKPLKTGWETLDAKIRIPVAATTIVAGRPGHGKTAFLLNLMINLVRAQPEKRFLFFSYEETQAAIFLRVITMLAGSALTSHRHRYPDALYTKQILEEYIKAGHTDAAEIESAKAELNELLKERLQLFDKPLHLDDLVNVIRQKNRSEPIGGVFIDYLQRVRLDESERKTKIDRISDELKNLAVETGLPIIIGAQINRDAIKDEDRIPSLASLKESGNIEEDANTVLLVYRASCQKEEKKSDADDMLIKALKARDGEMNVGQTLKFQTSTQVIVDDATALDDMKRFK